MRSRCLGNSQFAEKLMLYHVRLYICNVAVRYANANTPYLAKGEIPAKSRIWGIKSSRFTAIR